MSSIDIGFNIEEYIHQVGLFKQVTRSSIRLSSLPFTLVDKKIKRNILMMSVAPSEFFGDEEGNCVIGSGGLGGGEISGRDKVVEEDFGGEKVMGGGRKGLGLHQHGEDSGGGEAVIIGGDESERSERGGEGEVVFSGRIESTRSNGGCGEIILTDDGTI